MNNSSNAAVMPVMTKKEKRRRKWEKVKRYKYLYVMMIPAVVTLLLFNYLPMFGILIAFKDYKLVGGVFGSPWAANHGMEYFIKLFSEPYALKVLKNTILISLYRLLWGMPAPLLLALLINEVGNKLFKKTVQTVSYLPHFLSWVIVAGIINNIFSPSSGIVPIITKLFTGSGSQMSLLTEPKYFRTVLVVTDIWKEIGWSSILYLATISGIDVSQYESAIIDGASRFQRMIYITLPSLIPLVVTLLIMRCGSILNGGFDQIFNMQNEMVKDVSDIIDTYTYRIGLVEMDYGFSSAVGLFKSVVGIIMIFATNWISKKLTGEDHALWA